MSIPKPKPIYVENINPLIKEFLEKQEKTKKKTWAYTKTLISEKKLVRVDLNLKVLLHLNHIQLWKLDFLRKRKNEKSNWRTVQWTTSVGHKRVFRQS